MRLPGILSIIIFMENSSRSPLLQKKCLRMPWQWSATLAPGLLRGLERLWLPGLSAGLGQIPFGSWKKSLNVWLRSRGSVKKKTREIAAQMEEKADMRKAMMFLQKYGISLNLGAKIYQKYGDSVYSVLQENPYRLADDISGVGFKIADEIAGRIGIHTDSDYRIKSGMMYTLLQATGEGHVYLPKEELFRRSSELLGVDASYMEKHLMDLSMERKVIQKEEGEMVLVYPSRFYYLELNTARMLRELNIDCPEDEAFVQRRIAQIEKETGTTLDEMQKKAVTEAAGHGLFILTGGPGTGKTTTINAIIRFFLKEKAVNCVWQHLQEGLQSG